MWLSLRTCLCPAQVEQRALSLSTFVGHLFLNSLVNEKILHLCLQTLLTVPSMLKVECAAALLGIAGQHVSHSCGPGAKLYLECYLQRIQNYCGSTLDDGRLRKVSDSHTGHHNALLHCNPALDVMVTACVLACWMHAKPHDWNTLLSLRARETPCG